MAYAVNWYIENEIVYVHYAGATTADELRESLIKTKAMIEQSPRQLVHVLTDVGDVTEPLGPMDSLRIIREEGSHARAGWQIILREKSVLMKMGIAFGTSILKSRTRTFDTLDEADAFLRQMDDSLSWDKVNTALQIIKY